jgi:hypothetical protein
VVIQTIAITSLVPMDNLLKLYGAPDSGTTAFHPEMDLGYAAVFNISSSTLMLSTVLPCPVNLMTYWQANAKITLSSQRGGSGYVSPGQMARRC